MPPPAACHTQADGQVRPRFEVGDILRDAADTFLATHAVTPDQVCALRAISVCRTAALGGHAEVCLDCGHREISYNSCRNRHCPRCQWSAQEQWIERRSARLLETPYFHIVLTLPAELRSLALTNPRTIYDLLFRAASRSLLELGRDAKWLGADLGVTMVLHTWSRDLGLHPHVHCLVTGGGLSTDGTRWIASRENFLFPVLVLGKLFRGKFLAGLTALRRAGELHFAGCAADLEDPDAFAALVNTLYDKKWVAYAKRPMGGARHVIKYLGRYTHRVAISNSRVLDVTDEHVVIRTRGDATVTLTRQEFARRFLLHVLPKRFMKIRHYGLFAATNVPTKWVHAHELLAANETGHAEPTVALETPVACPQCGSPRVVRQLVDPVRMPTARGPPDFAESRGGG